MLPINNSLNPSIRQIFLKPQWFMTSCRPTLNKVDILNLVWEMYEKASYSIDKNPETFETIDSF